MKTIMTLLKTSCLFLLLQIWSVTVQAHAFIDQQHPKAGEELDIAPKSIVLTYTKSIEPTFSSIEITKEESGALIKTDSAKGGEGNPNQLILSLPELPSGDYHINWRVLSRDGHKTIGDYDFTIK